MAKEKEYYLWLDESGQFKELESEISAAPSLVGGVMCDKETYENSNPSLIRISTLRNPLYKRVLDDYYNMSNKRCNFSHAMELPNIIRAQVRTEMLEKTYEAGFKFVIFQNQYKLPIIDTNTTYLNILAEGVVQLLMDLSATENIRLNIIIGRRVDTEKSDFTEGSANIVYIDTHQYLKLIQERIIVAIAKLNYNKNNKFSYSVSMDSDKTNDFLILSDYVCCIYYGKDYRFYNEIYHKTSHKTCRDIIWDIFENNTEVYSIYENETKLKVRRYIAEGNYGVAFASIFSEHIDNKYLLQLKNGFNNLTEQAKDWQLEAFYTTIRSIIAEERAFELSLRILQGVLTFIDELELTNEQVSNYKFNLYLFMATVYTHMGEQVISLKYLNKCQELLPVVLNKQENFDLYFIYINRKIVNYQDLYDFEGNEKCGEEALDVADLLIENINQLKEIINLGNNTYYIQKAKLCGSMALTYYYWSAINKSLLADARYMSDQSIKNFSLNMDKQRQYMLRAQIEAKAGDIENAINFLAKGLNCDRNSIVKFCMETDISLFSWLAILKVYLHHLIKRHNDSNFDKIYNIIDQKAKQLLKYDFYPTHMLAINLGKIYMQKGIYKKAKECFKTVIELGMKENKYSDTWLIGVSAYAHYILVLIKNKDLKEIDQLRLEIINNLQNMKSVITYPTIKDLCDRWIKYASDISEESYTLLTEELFY